MKLIIPLFLIHMLQASSGHTQDLGMQLQQVMRDIYQPDAPGAALLVLKNDSIVISEGFGLRDMDFKNPINSTTNFRMASVSKQFTAFCLLLLARNNQLKLDDPVSKYLTELPSFAQNITIKNILTHSSGLLDYEPLIPDSTTGQITDADVLAMICKTDSLYFRPGTKFRYSNTGYCLLTQIVERVTGIPYPEFIRTKIFEPLQMKHSSIMQSALSIPQRAFGYHHNNGQWQFADQSITSATMGDGCVYTCLEDYAKWIRSLWNEQLISFNEKNNPLLPYFHIMDSLDYGFGWFTLKTKPGNRVDFHSGESTGFHNIVFHEPEKKLLIVIFSNSDDERISGAFDRVAQILNIALPGKAKDQSLFQYLHKIY